MTQSDAVEAISRLIPQMEGDAPDRVIMKYAREKDLSPAQVERLGHVFNTASTLSTMERDRSAAPPLMDVPKLVDNYYQQTSRGSKYASIFDEEEGQEKAAAAPLFAELPQVWTKPRQKEKASSDFTRPKEKMSSAQYLTKALPIARQLLSLAVDKALDRNQKIARCQKEAKGMDTESLTLLYNDLRQQLGTEPAKQLTGKFAMFNISDIPDLEDLFIERDRTGFRDKLASAWEDHLEANEAMEAFVQALPELDKHASCCEDFDTRREVRKFIKEADNLGKFAQGWGKDASAAEKVVAGPWDRSDQYAREAAKNWKEVEDEERKEDPQLSELIPSAVAGTFYGLGSAREEAAKLFLSELPAYANEMTTDGQLGKYLDRSLGQKNRQKLRDHQLDLSRVESDTRTMANLQDLVMRDNILSTKPFDVVWEAFNSIRRASPEVASDKSLLKIMLRQAVETQGLDIDSASASRKFEFPTRGGSRATWGTSQIGDGDRPDQT